MRIIKEGKKPLTEKEKTCHRCGCVFAYEKRDIHSDQRDGDWVYCPTCKAYIGVKPFNEYD